ncbi:MAG: T9SS type A sorting domain-containing protein, partial [Bacteroidia bacterium]|nr:T9SS type A sorting domain-containing protein [Bacteroidia bacterium]
KANWGTVGGRVRAIAVHPTDPQTLYIGAASGGIWKTTDGGANWEDIGYGLESLTFGAIAIDPKNPEIIYAGSGESMLFGNGGNFPGKGLFKSTDGGQSWILITVGPGNQTHFSDLEVSPYNSNIILATLASGYEYLGIILPNEGIWRSLDGGTTWNRTLDLPDAFDIAFHPADPNKVYAAIGGTNGTPGFFISNDQGATWEQSNTGLLLPAAGGRIQFDISKSNPNIIYAVIYDLNLPNSATTRAYKSVNGGTSWSQISVGTKLGGFDGSSWYDQGLYDLCIAVDPVDPNHVLIGNIELHRTTDGSTFTPVRPFGGNVFGTLAHPDYHKLVYTPSNPNILYIGCDGGIYKSTDKGYTVGSQNKGLSTLQFYRIASHPSNSRVFMGGMQDNAGAITTNGGTTWNNIISGDGMECFFDRTNPDHVLYASYQWGALFKSVNGGTVFSQIYNAAGAWITPFFMHPTNNQILYTANKKILKSTDAGLTFQIISGPNDISPVNIGTMAQSQVNPSNMIFGTGIDNPSVSVFIVKVSKDEGATWTDVTSVIPGESRWISRVVTDPVDANTMYLVRSGFSPGNKVYKTTNLGQTWKNISGNLPDLPCSDLFIDPEFTGRLFVANDIGVYFSTDGGISWNYASEGMPVVPVFDFDYVKIGTQRYLRAGTYGRSVFETILPSCDLKSITFSSQAEVDNFQASYPLCREIGGDVTISGSNINSITGLTSIRGIGGSLTIHDNPLLTSLAGLEGGTYVGGNLDISSNKTLATLTGMPVLKSVAGDLTIESNDALTSVAALGSIKSATGRLLITGNTSLTSLAGLEGVISIWGDLVVEGNKSLTSLSGLKNIDPTSIYNLTIRENDSLSACEVKSICDYLASPNGNVDIQNNATGCNSQAEVEKACLTSSEGIRLESEITIYPNPGKGLLVISTPYEIAIEQVAIYNSAGQKVQQEKPINNTVDISKLRPGMYFIEIRSDQLTARRRFVVE